MKRVRWRDPTYREGFTIVPNVVLNRGDLSHGAQRVYALLCFYAREDDRAWPRQEGLAKIMGVTDRSVQRYVSELVAAKLLSTRQRGQGRAQEYILLTPPVVENRRLRRVSPDKYVGPSPDTSDGSIKQEEAVEQEGEELRSSLRLRAVENSE